MLIEIRLTTLAGLLVAALTMAAQAQELMQPGELAHPLRVAQQALTEGDDPFADDDPPPVLQAPARPQPPAPQPGRDAGPGEPLRDPTTVEPDVRNILDPLEETGNRRQAVLPRLAGRISLANGQTIAVIEMDGQYAIVEQGSVVHINAGNQGTIKFTVTELTPSRAAVKLDQMDQPIELR